MTAKHDQGYVNVMARPQCSNCAARLQLDRKARNKFAEQPLTCGVGHFEISMTGLCPKWVAHPKTRPETRRFVINPA